MSRYKERLADRNNLLYMKTDRMYLGNFDKYIESGNFMDSSQISSNYYNDTKISTISSQAKQGYEFSSNSDIFTSTDYITSSQIDVAYAKSGVAGVTAHSGLTGLDADDHTHYYNDSRISTISSQAQQGYNFSSNSDLFTSSDYLTSSNIKANYYPSSVGNTHTSDTSNPHSVIWGDVSSTADHNDLQGLSDDDHSQYYNQGRIATISSQAKNGYDFSSNCDSFDSTQYITSTNIQANYYPSTNGNSLSTSYSSHSGNATIHYAKSSISLGDLSDTNIGGKSTDDYLQWDGDEWRARSITTNIQYYYYGYNQYSSQIIAVAYTDLLLYTDVKKDSRYSHTEGLAPVTVTANDDYQITYSVAYDSSEDALREVYAKIMYSSNGSGNGWVDLPGTLTRQLCYNNKGGSCCNQAITYLSSGSKIRLDAKGDSFNSITTHVSGCNLMVVSI